MSKNIIIPKWRLQQEEDKKKIRILDEEIPKFELEEKILKKLKNNMQKSKNDWLNINDLMKIKEVQKYFFAFVILSERGIGKTEGLRSFLEKKHTGETKFKWLRNQKKEIEKMWSKDIASWCYKNGWKAQKSNYLIYASEKDFIKKNEHKIIGYFEEVKTFGVNRSITTPSITSVVYDEFNSGKVPDDQFDLIATGLNTLQRSPLQYKSLKVFFMSNYEDAANDLLFKLGAPQEFTNKLPLLIFDWNRQTLIWNIPKGFYKSAHNLGIIPLAKRWTILSSSAYESQMGDIGTNRELNNILDSYKAKNRKALFVLRKNQTWTFNFYLLENKKIWVCRPSFEYLINVPHYAADKKAKLQFIDHKLIDKNYYNFLVKKILKEDLFCDSITTLRWLRDLINDNLEHNLKLTKNDLIIDIK